MTDIVSRRPRGNSVRERKRSRSLTNENHMFDIIRMNQPDKPIHRYRDSLFSSSSGFQNFRGFFTLALILLVLATLRVALENIIKYGILINYFQIFKFLFDLKSIWPTILSIFMLHFFIHCSFYVEKQLSKNAISKAKALRVICLNLLALLLWPIIAVFIIQTHVVSASIFCITYLCVLLKLVSFHEVNLWCRQDREKRIHKRGSSGDYSHLTSSSGASNSNSNSNYQQMINNNDENESNSSNGSIHRINNTVKKPYLGKLVRYPDNLNWKDIYYFMFAPTLCYELNFPRTERIRKRFLLKRILEVILLSQLIIALIQQWMVPTIHNSLRPLQDMDYTRMLERLLKLSIPNHVIWLIIFYTYFHSFLNVLGEILCFSDRQFYRDWWNAESLKYFWSNWNVPVHHFCVRHIYKPLLQRGYSRLTCTMIVFLISAILHEYLISVPLRMFGFWGFAGMALQIPAMLFVSKKFLSGHWANVCVWISLIIGQPLCILACYHEFYVLNYKNKLQLSN